MARVMLVDDHPVVRQGLSSFLATQSDLEVVAEAGTLAEARESLPVAKPDLILLDLQLPDGNGLALLDEIEALIDRPRVLVLTSYLEGDYVREALRRGAAGYLLKHSGTRALLDGIRAALRGELPLDPGAVRLLATPPEDPLAALTPREREVLTMLAVGLSNRGIGERLSVSEKTVKSHLSKVFDKLAVHDRTQAALWAKEHGL
jgi:DNA-binding NarL/FixJ family response regulator